MQSAPITKSCSRCLQEKSTHLFYADVRYRGGVSGWCRDCKRAYIRDYDVRRAQKPKPTITAKKCTLCGQEKPIEAFARNVTSKTGFSARCKDCRRRVENHAGLPIDEVSRIRAENNLRSNYGISIEEYAAQMQLQKGRCALCGAGFRDKRALVDHCHATGKLRGLLCFRCNQGLAYIERPDFVEQAKRYLKHPAWQNSSHS